MAERDANRRAGFRIAGCQLVNDLFGGAFKGKPAELHDIDPDLTAFIQESFAGFETTGVVDHHVHLAGRPPAAKGKSRLLTACCAVDASSLYVNESFVEKPLRRLAFGIVADAAEVDIAEDDWGGQYLERLADLAVNMRLPVPVTFHLLAYDGRYPEDGSSACYDEAGTEIYVSNRYVVDAADCLNAVMTRAGADVTFKPMISINPNRKDWREELDTWGCRADFLKWRPASMRIDPAEKRHTAFYLAIKAAGLKLFTHTGDPGGGRVGDGDVLDYNDPRRLETPLGLGVDVVMAHAAREGMTTNEDGRTVTQFEQFLAMLRHDLAGEPGYAGNLYGEISALHFGGILPGHGTQDKYAQLVAAAWEDERIAQRLLNGSDYPLTGLNVLRNTGGLMRRGMLTPASKRWLDVIYAYNPLLYDLVLKRHITTAHAPRRPMPPVVLTPLDKRRCR